MRQYFAFFLGSLAEAHLQAHEAQSALAFAEEATAYGRRAGTLAYELRAELVVAAAQLALGAHREVGQSLARCNELVEQTGAAALGPFTTELRARLAAERGEDPQALLRQAQAEFQAVSASGHVERLAKEIR